MHTASPSLLEMQRAWRAAIGDGNPAATIPHIVADAIPAEDRLAIYRNTAESTLVHALQLAYPAVRKLVGEEFFESAARAYLIVEWSHTAWLDEYGTSFPDFLRNFDPIRTHPTLSTYLADVATLERAVNHALHAADAEPLDLGTLAVVAPEDVERLRFDPHPSICLVRVATPADTIWNAVLEDDDAAMRAVDLHDGPVHLLVERRDDGSGPNIHLERIPAAAWRFAKALCDGISLGRAIEETTSRATREAGFAPESTLAGHLNAGRFTGFRLEP